MTERPDGTPRRPGNRETLVETIRRMQGVVRQSGWATFLLILLSGVVGGFARMSASHNPGWGGIFFLVGAAQTLLYAVPVGVLLYVGLTLLAGLVVFLRIRLGNAR